MLVLLSGVSGAGKDTVKQELIKRNKNVESLPSYTDRAPRNNDIPGVTYNFVTTQEFERMIEQGELYEYSKHHEHYYGTSKKLLNEQLDNGTIIVKDIEVNGVENLLKILKKSTISINSCFSSSKPATSSNFTFEFVVSESYTLLLSPNPCIFITKKNNTNIIIVGSKPYNEVNVFTIMLCCF